MNISATAIILKYKGVILIALSLLVVVLGLRVFMQPNYAKADAWGQCMTQEWVGPTLYTYDCGPSEAAAASSCAAAGGSFWSISIPYECSVVCSNGYDSYFCDIPPPPNCASFPTMDGCACSKSNACHTEVGTFSGGMCGAPDPAPCCDPAMGNACNTNSCGVSGGTVQCNGSCSGGVPAVVDACPSDAGVQCDISECAGCVPSAGTDCNTNVCGVPGGTLSCDGTTCSGGIPAPVDACTSDPGIQCSGPCICDPSTGNTCSLSNACGVPGLGTIQCNGSCDAIPPAPIDVCPAPGLQCSGPCVVPPPDPIVSLWVDKNNVRKNDTVSIKWGVGPVAVPADWRCRVYGPGVDINPSGFSGVQPSAPINAKSEFTAACTHAPSGTIFSKSVTVETTGDIQEI